MKSKTGLFQTLETTIGNLHTETISDERKHILQPLIDYIQSKVSNHQEIRINFICTHNSRRSHLSQVWAQTLAHHFNIKTVNCYSGGTENTALYPTIIDTLKQSGFQIEALSEGSNPIYSIKYASNETPIIGFSKKFEDAFNPESNFAAVMTCSQADGGCPFIAGAEVRIPITFVDPKIFDNTPQQSEKYLERSLQIATELKYVFQQINT